MQLYSKAIAAFLTGVVGVVAIWAPDLSARVSPEVIAAVSTVVATALVYALPNKAPGE